MALLDPKIWTDKIYINGWVAGGGGTRDVVSPSTGEKLGSIGMASVADANKAVAEAAKAQVEEVAAAAVVQPRDLGQRGAHAAHLVITAC